MRIFPKRWKFFLWGTKEITPEVLEACLGEGLFVSETELAYILSGRNQHQLQEWLTRAQGDDVLFALRQTVRHFMTMLSVRSALQSQVSLEEALAGLSPPLFLRSSLFLNLIYPSGLSHSFYQAYPFWLVQSCYLRKDPQIKDTRFPCDK